MIGIDIDGVLAQSTEAALGTLKKWGVFPEHYTTGQNGCSYCPYDSTTGLGYKELTKDILNRLWHYSDAWLHAEPYTEAQDMVRKLSALYPIFYVTSRSRLYEDTTKAWLTRHVPYTDNPVLIMTEDKADVVRSLSLDYFIDDSVQFAQQVEPLVGKQVYLLERPWNRLPVIDTEQYPRIKRCGWSQIVKELTEHAP